MISVENLTKQYGATTVVDGVSMVIERNSITVIVAPPAREKSTLLRMINRLVEPTRGRVLIDGNDTTASRAPAAAPDGYRDPGHGLFPHRTVAENIATVPRLLGWDAARIRARVENCCACPARSAGLRRSIPASALGLVSSSASVWRGRSPLSPPYC